MPAAPDLNIDHVAKLARLALTPEEQAKFAQLLGEVLHHSEQLAKANLGAMEIPEPWKTIAAHHLIRK